MAQSEVGLKSELVGLVRGDFKIVGCVERDRNFPLRRIRFDFDLRGFGVRGINQGDCNVAFDFSIFGKFEWNLESFANFMGERRGGGTEDKRCFFSVCNAERKKLGEAGLVAFGVPVSNVPR